MGRPRKTISVCKVCHTEKNIEDFKWNGRHYLKTCNECYLIKARLRDKLRYHSNEKNRKDNVIYRSRQHTYKYKYNTSVEEVTKTLELQSNRCANLACGVEISLTAPKELVKPAVVDHNHVTGNFRALLCNRCNVVLGHVEKNPHVIEGLKNYLKQHQNNNS